MPRKLPYQQGDWFGVPLRSTGYAVGRITRVAPGGKLLVGYFFGPRREQLPGDPDAEELQPEDAALICRFSDLAFLRKEWPLLGSRDPAAVQEWPLPLFARQDAVSGDVRLVRYQDDDPRIELEAIRTPGERASDHAPDGAWGNGAVEEKLTSIFGA